MNLHFLFITLGWFVQSSFATSFYLRPMSEFAREAPTIVRGRARDIRTDYGINADGSKVIYTYASFEIRDVLKGSLSKRVIQLRKLGGTKDGLTLEVPSSPEFQDNEESVLFLSNEKEDQSYEVMGMELGKFGIEEKDGETFLTGGLLGFKEGHGDETGLGDDPRLSENQRPWSIQDLRVLLRSQGVFSRRVEETPTPTPVKMTASPAIKPALEPPAGSATPQNSSDSSGLSEWSLTQEKPGNQAKSAAIILLTGGFFFLLFLYLRRRKRK